MDWEDKIFSAVLVFTKKLKNGEMGYAAWSELVVEDLCQNNLTLLRKNLIPYSNQDLSTLSLPNSENLTPISPLECLSDLIGRVPEMEERNFLPLKLPAENVIFVDSNEGFVRCLREISQSDIIGIDGEWKPSLIRRSKMNPISILQIATRSYCFILDFIRLGTLLTREEWTMLSDTIQSPKRIKVGFALQGDFNRLREFPGFRSINIAELPNLFDLKVICGRLAKTNPEIFSTVEELTPGRRPYQDFSLSLSKLVEILLGVPLDKREQMSNWERRPLRTTQMTYAALDAVVLILLFDKVRQTCLVNNVAFPPDPLPVVEDQLELDIALFPVINIDKPVDCTKISFICDTHLKGLCRRLRNVGINAEYIDESWTEQKVFCAINDDERFYLTSSLKLPSAKNRFPRDSCFAVPNCLKSVQQLEYIKKMFNIFLTKENVLSRCAGCNSNDFIQTSFDELRLLFGIIKQTLPELQAAHLASGDNFRVTSSPTEIESKDTFAVSFKNVVSAAEAIDFQTGLIRKSGVMIDAAVVSSHKIGRVREYFICHQCGKVYWPGSHFRHFNCRLCGLIVKVNDENILV